MGKAVAPQETFFYNTILAQKVKLLFLPCLWWGKRAVSRSLYTALLICKVRRMHSLPLQTIIGRHPSRLYLFHDTTIFSWLSYFAGDILPSAFDSQSLALCFESDQKLIQLAGYNGPPVVQSTMYEEPLLHSRAAVVGLSGNLSCNSLAAHNESKTATRQKIFQLYLQ